MSSVFFDITPIFFGKIYALRSETGAFLIGFEKMSPPCHYPVTIPLVIASRRKGMRDVERERAGRKAAGFRKRYVGKAADPFYLSPAWRAVRRAVLIRDHWWCQRCKRRSANTVHHLLPRSERPDLALVMENLEAVCCLCHAQEHPEKGEKTRRGEPKEKPALNGIRVIKV